MPCLVPVGWNVTEDSPRTRLPAAVLVTQFEHRVDVSIVGFDDVSKLRAKKEIEGKVISSRFIAALKLVLDSNRCKKGQALKDASYLKEMKLTPDSIETWCLAVPVMYPKADKPSEEMQDNMTREMITTVRTVINKDYNTDDTLEFESESVAVMAHLAARRSQSYEKQDPILVWDAGGSTGYDFAAAMVIGGALELITAAGASSGTYYMWEELNKACGSNEKKFNPARKVMEAMTEACDITDGEAYDMLSNLQRRGYSTPKIIVVGRAPGANSMIQAFLVSELQGILRKVFRRQTLPDIEVPGGLDVGTSVCRGAALPYNCDPVSLPKELRGKDNALVVIKNSGVDKLSKQWLCCQVDGAPKKFVYLCCYPKAAGLTMNALLINLEGHAKDGDRIEYMISQPDPRKPTAVAIDVKCPNGRVATQCELIKDRERLQLRLVKGRTFQDHDEVLQLAARADGQGDAYDGPDTEPEEGSTSVQLPLHANKRGQENGGKASPPGQEPETTQTARPGRCQR
ncbi:hypothetical protein ISF_09640 [Cordyceps fumosorosea ARSEF 2679]|uniref:Uncharacterized protein n=1 Tax=Cordyceps fumosorosea (strain ARSEF 2679) TaxID=1081104 RepID=A0A167EVH2_CORFA|nr:hypothetical protein ISF_09640 [Cordyceps fumosorosea ARSEF 2679]OAA44446.1 hypothetical protein ISF_09640 [Cordyceps fumosorosea ARSEF 2679]